MKYLVSDAIAALEAFAPLYLQDDYDNSGLQTGFPSQELRGVLVCLDVTEEVVREAASLGCNLIVSHHPLLFRPLRCVSDRTYQQRCVVDALSSGISIYSVHTNLDNARGGVNFKIASLLGLGDVRFLQPKAGVDAGAGVIGLLPSAVRDIDFLKTLSRLFGVRCVRHSVADGAYVHKIALCGGAGAFLMKDAIAAGADCFVTGELHYHDFFDNQGMLLVALGHYQSERFTIGLLQELLSAALPGVEVVATSIDTNAEKYLV